jgi:DNA polymerase IV
MYLRNVLHVNVTSFYVAVSQAANPKLRSYPVAVATTGASRRMVLDVSSTAHQAGVRRGMLLDIAKRKCRDLVVLDPTPDLYDRAFSVILSEADQLSPQVEPAGPGHVFIDLTGTERLWGDPIDSAAKLRLRIRDKYRLDPAVGVATNKLISKVATRVVKPYGLCRIIAGCEEEFLGPLPVRLLPGIDPKVITQLMQFNISIIKELIRIPEAQLAQVFGTKAADIHQVARGIDDTPVRMRFQAEPAIREMHVFGGQTNDDAVAAKALFSLVQKAGTRLRQMGMAARTLKLTITYSDGSRGKEQCRLRTPLNGDLSLYDLYKKLLDKTFTRRIRLSSMMIDLCDLTYPYGQLDLFDNNEKEEHLMASLDAIRKNYGEKMVRFYGRSG